jgi:hypothetical protein
MTTIFFEKKLVDGLTEPEGSEDIFYLTDDWLWNRVSVPIGAGRGRMRDVRQEGYEGLELSLEVGIFFVNTKNIQIFLLYLQRLLLVGVFG